MCRPLVTASIAALMAASLPIAAHAATATATNTSSVGITLLDGDFTSRFSQEIETTSDLDNTGGGTSSASSEVETNGFANLTSDASANAGPQISSAFGARDNFVEIEVSSTSDLLQNLSFELEWLISGLAEITNEARESSSTFGSVALNDSTTGENLFLRTLGVTGVVGGEADSIGELSEVSFDLAAGETRFFNVSTSSEAQANVIPLPAGLPLLLAGLGALALLRRSRRS